MSPLLDNNTDDDLTLRTRRSASEERRTVDLDEPMPADREVTLNTGTVLALFFTLALICAVFFGFGYSMGRKSTQATASSSDSSGSSPAAAAPDAPANGYKPAPGSPAIQAIPGYMSQSEANATNEKAGTQSTVSTPAPVAPKPARTADAVAASAPAPVVRTAPAPVPVVIPPVSRPPSAGVDAAGVTYVQIAAVSHQEDADVLLNALKRRGYKVVERPDSDNLIHVQIGPFSNRKDADATRQKLLGDGYNAFLK
jgi:DedD protein